MSDEIPLSDTEGTEAKILSIEDLYSDLKKTLKEAKGGDAEALPILESELLHPNVNEKDGVAKALKSLLDLAATRARVEKQEAPNGSENTSEA